jgi:hypothetical protein
MCALAMSGCAMTQEQREQLNMESKARARAIVSECERRGYVLGTQEMNACAWTLHDRLWAEETGKQTNRAFWGGESQNSMQTPRQMHRPTPQVAELRYVAQACELLGASHAVGVMKARQGASWKDTLSFIGHMSAQSNLNNEAILEMLMEEASAGYHDLKTINSRYGFDEIRDGFADSCMQDEMSQRLSRWQGRQ